MSIYRDKPTGRWRFDFDRYVGSEYSLAFLPKVEISIWVSDDRVAEVSDRSVRTARTGRIGDGKIFILDMAWPEPLEF